MRPLYRIVKILLATSLLMVAGFCLTVFLIPELPNEFDPPPQSIVTDVTGMNPIAVARQVRPTSIDEIRDLVRNSTGPISIGGGRYSMGGQIGSPDSLHIDMRSMNKVLDVDPIKKRARVQAGATWRSIQDRIDPLNLSLSIIQSYSNFTVGGSLSVNAHGRYIGLGPLVGSVESIKVVLADGSVVDASRDTNRELFSGCIGGYGGLGIIVEAILILTENEPLQRVVQAVPVSKYREFFASNIGGDSSIVFQNGDLIPIDYDHVYSVDFRKTTKPVTIPDRLQPIGQGPSTLTRLQRALFMEVPFGMRLRRYLEPLRYLSKQVVWRNYEASYDVAELQPIGTASSSFVLQEYFLPVAQFEGFVAVLRDVFNRHKVEIANVSIRHASIDTDTILSWARGDVFAFVLYYRQLSDPDSRRAVGEWTRELIQASVQLGGTYYLPYQLHASKELFLKAYPRAPELFTLKKRLDPESRFRGGIWDAYFEPNETNLAQDHFFAHPKEVRSEVQSFLTLPEWRLVYASEDLASVTADHPQHYFGFFHSIWDFWLLYARTVKFSNRLYAANWGYHFMNVVIGLNTSIEYAIKGAYENSVGRVTSWLTSGTTPEGSIDHFIATTFTDYAQFIRTRAWYQYPFLRRLQQLWQIDPTHEVSSIRHFERLASFSVELLAKAALAKLFSAGTEAIYETEQEKVVAVAHGKKELFARLIPNCELKQELASDLWAIECPRYEPFTEALSTIVAKDSDNSISLIEIAGNQNIAATITVSKEWQPSQSSQRIIHSELSSSDPLWKRVHLSVPVKHLLSFLRDVTHKGGKITHVYDY